MVAILSTDRPEDLNMNSKKKGRPSEAPLFIKKIILCLPGIDQLFNFSDRLILAFVPDLHNVNTRIHIQRIRF